MIINAIILSVLVIVGDIFLNDGLASKINISFFILGLVALLAHNRPRSTILFSVLTGMAMDLFLPGGIFGLMIVWHLCFYFAAQRLLILFFDVNRNFSLIFYTFIISFFYKISLMVIDILSQWWAHYSFSSIISWYDFLSVFIGAILTGFALFVFLVIGRYLNKWTRRLFLIRH